MGWGDEVMVTGQARVMQERDPRKVRVVYEKPRFHEAWLHNPRIAGEHERGDFQELVARERYLRPYMRFKGLHQWQWKRYGPPKGELYFSPAEQAFGERHAGCVILEPTIKPGASPNKEWGWVNWNKLAFALRDRGVRVTQLGPVGTPLLEGAEHIVTRKMRLAAAVMSRARAAVLPEGGMHHVAAAVGIPAVVIFGGYISPEVTGYDGQDSFFVRSGGHELGCGMRVRCTHCAEAMGAIKPGDVFERVMQKLS